MKILFLTYSLETGGAERQLLYLANGLAKRGHDVAVGVMYQGGSLESELDSSRVTLVQFGRKSRWDAGFLLKLVRFIREWIPMVVIGYLGMPNMLSSLARLFLPGCKSVWGVRASEIDYSDAGMIVKLANWAEWKTARFAHLVVANSHLGKQHLIDTGFSNQNITVVHNGIDTNTFRIDRSAGLSLRESCGCDADAVLVGIVARLDPLKDHETFLHAAALAAQQEEALRFVCVGGGPFEHSLKMRCFELGLNGKVVWTGNMTNMPSVYNALDICCLSSVTEGFPNVLGEAMSCGVPCVATDVGDAARLMGEFGVVVPSKNPEALAQGIVDLVGRLHSEDSADIRERIVNHFSLDRMVQDSETLLQGLLHS